MLANSRAIPMKVIPHAINAPYRSAAEMTVRKLRPVALANIKVATVYQRSERSFFSPIFAGVTENQSQKPKSLGSKNSIPYCFAGGRNLTSHIWTERLTARSNVYFATMPDVRAFAKLAIEELLCVAARVRRSIPTKNKPDKNR